MMAASDWKILRDSSEKALEYVPFLESRKFFAVDASGSTAGAILQHERDFVEHLQDKRYFNADDELSLWGTYCDIPTKAENFAPELWVSEHRGTSPSSILEVPEALATIRKSDVWYLVTDGEIWASDVHQLAYLAESYNIFRVPTVFLIVGYRAHTPELTNISVGISFFAGAQDTLILFKEATTRNLYVIAGKGCFAPLAGSGDLASWDDVPVFDNEEAFFHYCATDFKIQVTKAESRVSSPKGLSLGEEWEKTNDGAWVDLDLLLQAGLLSDKDVFDLFAEEAFNNLAVAYKTRKRMQDIRAFAQRQKIEQVAPKLEDVSGAAALIAKMGLSTTTEDDRKELQRQLRGAHAKNREHYQNNVASFANSVQAQFVRKRNQLVDAALRTLASIEAAGFNAEILSRRSNRARRADAVSTYTYVTMASIDLDGPACKGYCLVCRGEDEIMSICLKELDAENKDDNTTDFALNFPLAAGASKKNVNLISSQNVCFQCALSGPGRKSIYNETLKAIIPAVQYRDLNKKYIHDQLYSALTAGLSTGAAGIAQLFMAILDEVLRTKPWAGADDTSMLMEEENEALQRQRTFQWMLDQLVENTRTRETFNELGDWVNFPHALAWVAKDFDTNGLASFVVTYPVTGFAKLLSFGQKTGAFTDDIVGRMKIAKAVYSVAAKYLADMQTSIKQGDHSDQWKQKYLEPIYTDFNAPFVPRDLGSSSIVTNLPLFEARLSICLGVLQQEDNSKRTDESRRATMHKIQIILFWLVFKQRSHCTAQTFFKNISQLEHIANAVLDATLTVPEPELRLVLFSIFAKEDAMLIDADAFALHNTLVPFTNPFGASVLRCGVEACGQYFYRDSLKESRQDIHIIRKARANHLIKVFGIQGRFEKSQTGLPEPVAKGTPPTSTHTSMHISLVRTWAELSHEERKAIVYNAQDKDVFVVNVRKRICKQGRGDVHSSEIEQDVRNLLPSFFEVLKLALKKEGMSDKDVTVYEHDFDRNSLEAKIEWELDVLRQAEGWEVL